MTGELILITGGTGMVGFRVILEALKSGYRVRAAIRKPEGAERVRQPQSIKPYLSNLDFVLVPDMLIDGAYDDAVKGVTYIIHVSSPVPRPGMTDFQQEIIVPAIQGTVGILESAKKTTGIKRVVMTSSVASLMTWEDMSGPNAGKVVFNETSEAKAPQGPYDHAYSAYSASKILALQAAERYTKEHSLGFDVVSIHPSLVTGANELNTDPDGFLNDTNNVAMSPVLGKENPPMPGFAVSLHDVARLHVLALDSMRVKGGQRLVANTGGVEGVVFNTSIDIVKKHFPEAIADGRLPLGGNTPTVKVLYDPSSTEKILGFKFQSYEEAVISATQHYLNILKN